MTLTATPSVPDQLNVQEAIVTATDTVRRLAEKFGVHYPGDTTAAGRYSLRPGRGKHPDGANLGWTTSFVPGAQWLAYELTHGPEFRAFGEAHVGSFTDRITRRIGLDTHDLGFLYTLSCVAAWKLVGDRTARQTALSAAEHLMARFLQPAGILQAWGDLSDPAQQGRAIIDSLMNTPLLLWAAQESSNQRFADAARRHVYQLRDHILRPDNSTFHTFYWDPTTGAPLRGGTEQGEADASCWARGQAWGILGFALNYRYLQDASLLTASARCADYFLAHLPEDGVPVWDLVFDVTSGQPRDSSAAAIAACGLDELARHVSDADQSAAYRATSRRILAALIAGYVPRDEDSDALLLHGVYDWPKGVGIDEGTLWGDYFYLEALTRASHPDWTPYW